MLIVNARTLIKLPEPIYYEKFYTAVFFNIKKKLLKKITITIKKKLLFFIG